MNQLTDLVADWIQSELTVSEQCTIAFPGGQSPIELMHSLRDLPLNWSNICVTLVDDRLVSPDSPHSNARQVRHELLVNKASAACFRPLELEDAKSPVSAHLESRLAIPDVVILGMGMDGHFASIFPHQREGFESQNGFFTTPPIGNPCVPRISMTWHLINQAKHILLLVNSFEKQRVIQKAVGQSITESCPVTLLTGAKRPVFIQWPSTVITRLN